MLDVKFYESFADEEKLLKYYLPKDIRADFAFQTIQETRDEEPVSKLVCIRTQSILPAAWEGKIRGILSRSQGFDHLQDIHSNISGDIPCGYLGTYCSRAVAEHAIMVAIALMRKLIDQLDKFKKFNRDYITGLECRKRKALVVGVGNIGREIADLCKILGMEVRGVDIKPKKRNLKYVSLEKGVQWAEIVFCALPLTELTKNLLNYELLNSTENNLFLINISRGEITPIDDLKRLLDEQKLKGLGLDVFENEPELGKALRSYRKINDDYTKSMLDLTSYGNVIFTPHNAFNTEEALERKVIETAEAVKIFLKKGKFPYQV